MDEQCPVDGCQNTLHPQPAMNKLCRVDNKTYICADCGNAQAIGQAGIKAGIRTPFNAKPKDGALIIKTETTRSLLANNALQGHGWPYDLRAVAKEAAETGGLEFWAGDDVHHEQNVVTLESMRVLKNFECMHSALDIVEATYQHTGCDAYFEEKAATLNRRGLLYWSSELDTGNLARLVHLINLYAHNGAR